MHLQKPRLNGSYCTPPRCEVGSGGQHVGKEKKKKHHSVNQEHLRKDPGQMLFSKRLKYETTFRNNSQGKKKKNRKKNSSINPAERNKKRLFGNKCLATCFGW